MASLPTPHLAFDECIALEQRTGSKFEYRNGDIRTMAEASPAHSLMEANLIAALAPQLADSGCRVYAASLRILIEASELYTYPDISIVCGPLLLGSGMSATNPKAVIEVLAPSTRRYDDVATGCRGEDAERDPDQP